MTTAAREIEIRGVVQGVGFRPYVVRLAQAYGVRGRVGNDESGVFVTAEAEPDQLTDFIAALTTQAPPLASILDVAVRESVPTGADSFEIVPSAPQPGARTLVPPDVAVCADCLAQMWDPADRRYRHPFITCTQCGPRFTIITDLPYDRPATTMAAFEMCPTCAREYDDPSDRRFHAQPISCHDCGPRLSWQASTAVTHDDAALVSAQQTLAAGGIVAIKGIGGFHLMCDAGNPDAVATLRARKRRPGKPFAVMAAEVAAAAEVVRLTPQSRALLSAPQRPIVLAPALVDLPGVAPGLDELGVLLPYAPVHHLLFAPVPGAEIAPPRLLVMTSGNRSDEPLCYRDEDAFERLADLVDGWLLHDREIAVPCEDSVVTVGADGAELPVRRSRGYAPLPVRCPDSDPLPGDSAPLPRGPGRGAERTVLAVGAEIKNTFALLRGDSAFLSAHIGDMGTLETQAAFARSVDQLLRIRAATPDLVVADPHPGYLSRGWAERFAAEHGIDLVEVQHHHAHLGSLLAEHQRLGDPILGVTFDGTGYGCDRQIWGGEFLAMGADITGFDRLGHLRALPLPGGAAAVRAPYRIGVGLAAAVGEQHRPNGVSETELRIAGQQPPVPTTSVGRLFDGVAALLGVRQRIDYEAQAAIELEVLARTAQHAAQLPFPLRETEQGTELDWQPLVRELLRQQAAGVDRAALALGFHHALAGASAALVERVATGPTVGLTGGVFANRLLTNDLSARLRASGYDVLTHRLVPCSDAGLALGQAAIGRAIAARNKGENSCV